MDAQRAQSGDTSTDKSGGAPRPADAAADAKHAARRIDDRRLFDNAADAMLVTDAEGNYIDANARACELTGYSIDELLTMRIGDLTIPSERAFSHERFDLLRREGRSRQDRIVRRKDGTCVTVEAHAAAIGDGVYVTTLRDVSDRLAAERKLRRSVDAYATLVDLCNAAVVSAGPDGRIISWNPAAEALFGYSAEEARTMAIDRLIPARWRSGHNSLFSRHVNTRKDEPFRRSLDAEALRKDGTEVPVEISLGVGRRGSEPLFTAVIRDMTQHRRFVEQLNDALQQVQFHVERMPLAYIVWDTDFNAVEWNPAAERIFGFTKEEAIGKSAYDLVVPTDPDVVATVRNVWEDLLKGDTSSHSINANVRKDGSRLICEWFNTPLRDPRGHIRGAASMAMDVSEREAMEAQLRDAQKLESLGVLAGGVAHDFNSSLMVILGNASLLRALPGLPSKAMEYIELIENAGLRAGEFIVHLLAYARTGHYNPQPTDLNDALDEVATLVRSAIGKRHELVLKLADRLPRISADRSQIEQIVLNLCINAMQAQPAGGVVSVSTRVANMTKQRALRCLPHEPTPGRYVELVVSDTGLGMDEATVARIFDPFFTTKPEGHGLGLAVVRGILRQHNAFVRVDSKLGKGTKFHILFPIQEDERHRLPRGPVRIRPRT
ncbi:MAG: PAS domain S-box protein [Phycisphaerae bacterium]